MTPEEITAATMLRGVTYPTACWDKKFAATVQRHLELTPPMIGEKMVPQLWRLLYRYRRQIKHPERQRYLKLAAERMAPDFRKLQAEQKERNRFYKMKREAAAQQPPPQGKTLCEVFAEEAGRSPL